MLVDANNENTQLPEYVKVYDAVHDEVVRISNISVIDSQPSEMYRNSILSHYKFFIATSYRIVNDMHPIDCKNVICIRKFLSKSGMVKEYGLRFRNITTYVSMITPMYLMGEIVLTKLFGSIFTEVSFPAFDSYGESKLYCYIGWLPINDSILTLKWREHGVSGTILGYSD